jgi:hypothetical protein
VIDTQSAGFVMQGRVINGGELQKSGYGCWVFSLQQSFAAAELESFHKNMKAAATIHDKTKLHTVSWLAYPPRMVYLAQSATFIEYYMQSRPYNRDEVMKLTNNNVAGYGFESAQAHFKKILAETFSRRKDHELEEALGEKSLIKPR